MAIAQRRDIVAPPLWTAHLPWISFALTRAGVHLSGQAGPLAELPAGVNGYVGWGNRLLFASTYLWVVLAALAIVRRLKQGTGHYGRHARKLAISLRPRVWLFSG